MGSFVVLGLTIVICIHLNIASSKVICDNECSGKLVFTHVIYRHGDRSPDSFYPNDPHSNPNDWPVNLNQLTNLGKQQLHRFGQWQRQRYGDVLLPQKYSEKDIYVRSSDTDRTLESAYANLAGLYPPIGDDVWNDTINWRPIPVHTVPRPQDFILASFLPPCPVYDKEYSSIISSDVVHTYYEANKVNIIYALSHAGYNTSDTAYESMLNVLRIRDTLTIESFYNKTLPAWTESVFPSQWMDDMYVRIMSMSTETDLATKFRFGYFLKDVLDRSMSKAAGALVPNYSAWFYSAHETNIAAVLGGLGIINGKPIEYTAAIMFELRVRQGVPYLEIYYKRSSDDCSPELMYIPTCGYSCTLANMYKIYADILPTIGFEAACRDPMMFRY